MELKGLKQRVDVRGGGGGGGDGDGGVGEVLDTSCWGRATAVGRGYLGRMRMILGMILMVCHWREGWVKRMYG